MSKHTATPRVRDRVYPTGATGTFVDSPELSGWFPQFVPVLGDGSETSTLGDLDNQVALESAFEHVDTWPTLTAMELHVIHEIAAAGATPRRFDIGFIIDAAFMWDETTAAFIQKPGKSIAWASHWARLY